MPMTRSQLTGHLKWKYSCPTCGRTVRGNARVIHERACLHKARAKAAEEAAPTSQTPPTDPDGHMEGHDGP